MIHRRIPGIVCRINPELVEKTLHPNPEYGMDVTLNENREEPFIEVVERDLTAGLVEIPLPNIAEEFSRNDHTTVTVRKTLSSRGFYYNFFIGEIVLIALILLIFSAFILEKGDI